MVARVCEEFGVFMLFWLCERVVCQLVTRWCTYIRFSSKFPLFLCPLGIGKRTRKLRQFPVSPAPGCTVSLHRATGARMLMHRISKHCWPTWALNNPWEMRGKWNQRGRRWAERGNRGSWENFFPLPSSYPNPWQAATLDLLFLWLQSFACLRWTKRPSVYKGLLLSRADSY